MEEYEVLTTEIFSNVLEKVDNRIRVWAEKVKEDLRFNPYNGKQLRFEWFRERKFENYRLYYFVSEVPKRVLAIILAPKKDQEKIIEQIIQNKEEFWKLVRETKPNA